ncbi:MAG: hypothetical protein ACI9Y1_000395 [Lentisphaeria bacterium]|jgi:hypothetical protein
MAKDFGLDSRRLKQRTVILCKVLCNAEAESKDKLDGIIYISAALSEQVQGCTLALHPKKLY